jgi:hypothetical protein
MYLSLGRLKLARKPSKRIVGFQRIGTLAIHALKRAAPFAARRQRK